MNKIQKITEQDIIDFQDRGNSNSYGLSIAFCMIIILYLSYGYFTDSDLLIYRAIIYGRSPMIDSRLYDTGFPFTFYEYIIFISVLGVITLKNISSFMKVTNIEDNIVAIDGQVVHLSNYETRKTKEYKSKIRAFNCYEYNKEKMTFEYCDILSEKFSDEIFDFQLNKNEFDELSLNDNVFYMFSKSKKEGYGIRLLDK